MKKFTLFKTRETLNIDRNCALVKVLLWERVENFQKSQILRGKCIHTHKTGTDCQDKEI